MRHRRKTVKLNRTNSHRKAMLRNLASQLFIHERLTTTEAKAKALKPFAEHLITVAKNDTVHSRRNVARHISDKAVVIKLFTELSPRFKNRPGGYTRLMKLANRLGDNAKMTIIELVEKEKVLKHSATAGRDHTDSESRGDAAGAEKEKKGRRLTRKKKGQEEKKSGD